MRVDPFNDVFELNEDNAFCGTLNGNCSTFNISNTIVGNQKFTYPIIFIHGLNSDNTTWNSFLGSAQRYFGWTYEGDLDYCLNPDNNNSTADNVIGELYDFSEIGIADCYTINFDTPSPIGCSLSNQSAIVRQGQAVKDAIEKVLDRTGAEKVILVGHSMGGLAAREYIQNESIWQPDGNHHVAKLFTIATPNGGSGVPTIGLSNIFPGFIDGDSEAVRDLRYPYNSPLVSYYGTYLFGGFEISNSGYVNYDVNCDGDSSDLIIGLNDKNIPLDINYSCMFDTGDEVVADDNADLNQYPIPMPPLQSIHADKFEVDDNDPLNIDHLNIHVDPDFYGTIIQGLDEPTYYNLAYSVPLNSTNFGYITEQAENTLVPSPNDIIDWDDYKIEIFQNGTLNVDIKNISVHNFALYLIDEGYNVIQEVQASGESNIGFSYPITSGTYFVELVSIPTSNSWRFPYAYSINFTPDVTTPLFANFSSSTQEGCQPFTVNFSNQSLGSPTGYSWTFEGGTPSTSTAANPSIVYNQAGVYPVSLTVSSSVGNHTASENGYITVKSSPDASFSFSTQGNEVSFNNQTTFDIDAPSYIWDFGDGFSSILSSPTHTFQNDGNYLVLLTATNSCGSSSFTQSFNIMTTSIEETQVESEVKVFPNPSRDKLTISIEGKYLGDYQISIVNSIGQVVRQVSKIKLGHVLELQMNTFDLANGSYFIQIHSEQETLMKKIIKL